MGEMPFSNLSLREKRICSQNGEDGVIAALFSQLEVSNRFFVEFGCGDGTECNSAYLLQQGWRGLLMDSSGISKNPLATIHKEFVTAQNINELLSKYEVPQSFGLLSIDIDGNDFWVWAAIVVRPQVVVIEYNASIPPNERLAIVYDPDFKPSGTSYFGASLLAMKELGQRKGYTLVHCERAGVNAFFVANELLPGDFRPRPIEEIYRFPNYRYMGWRNRRETGRQMIDPFAGQG